MGLLFYVVLPEKAELPCNAGHLGVTEVLQLGCGFTRDFFRTENFCSRSTAAHLWSPAFLTAKLLKFETANGIIL